MRRSARSVAAFLFVVLAGCFLAFGFLGCERRDEVTTPRDDAETAPGIPGRIPEEIEPIRSFDTRSGMAEVLALRIDERAREFVLDVRYESAAAGEEERRIVLGPCTDRPGWRGIRASIEGGEAFAMSMVWSEDESGRLRAEEATAEDNLTVEVSPAAAGKIVETYDWRDATQSFLVDPALVPVDAELRSRFREFYPGNSSLDTGVDGRRLGSLLGAEGFSDWFAETVLEVADFEPKPVRRLDPELQKYCNWANGCVLIKCPFGGFMNPICHVCMGSSIACFIVFLACDVFGWC